MNATPIVLPETSLDRYIGGMAALNLPTGEWTGHWHREQTFFQPRRKLSRSFISGAGCSTDTTALLGHEGIVDCTQLVDALRIAHQGSRVFVATHARAVADLVLGALQRGESPDFVDLDDYMPRPEHKRAVFKFLDLAAPKLDDDIRQQLLAWQIKHPA